MEIGARRPQAGDLGQQLRVSRHEGGAALRAEPGLIEGSDPVIANRQEDHFSGGGNVGIYYPKNGLIRPAVIERLRPHHRCLVFSQSARGPEKALSRPQVTVWCRDANSKAILEVERRTHGAHPGCRSLYWGF